MAVGKMYRLSVQVREGETLHPSLFVWLHAHCAKGSPGSVELRIRSMGTHTEVRAPAMNLNQAITGHMRPMEWKGNVA